MELADAIKYLQSHYGEIDPSHLEAPLMWQLLRWTPTEIYQYLLAPEELDGTEPMAPEEWETG